MKTDLLSLKFSKCLSCMVLAMLSLICLSSKGQNYVLKGRVLDDSNNEPVEFANVYINKTTIGTVTDTKGEFELVFSVQQPEIIISFTGYEPVIYALDVNALDQIYVFKLSIDTEILKEVEVKSTRDSTWYYNLEVFKNEFIGRTIFGSQCELVNPDDLIIIYSYKTNILEVRARETLIIDNPLLGYKVRYILDHFKYNLSSGFLTFAGYSFFEPMSGRKGKMSKWSKNRLKAYKGSSMHFFRALSERRIKEEGFNLRRLIRKPNPDRPNEEEIKHAREAIRKSQSHSSVDYKPDPKVHDILRRARLPRTVEYLDTTSVPYSDYLIMSEDEVILKFNDHFNIVYTGEKEEINYIRSKNIFRTRKPTFQTSVISLTTDSVKINDSGNLSDPFALIVEGYWAWEKVGDMLPLDYDF